MLFLKHLQLKSLQFQILLLLVTTPPRAEFPKFDGLNPKLWKKSCDKYFRVYAVSPEFWVEHATMHFTGNAALWF